MTLPNSMKAIVVSEPNDALSLKTLTLDVPVRQEGQHLIKVERVGLNPVDAKLVKSGFEQWQYPHVIGLDAVGTVVDCDTGAQPAIGKRVMLHSSILEQGVLSEYIVVPSHALIDVPENVDADTAATIPCAGLTAYLSIERLSLTEDQTLLVEGGSTAVGQFAIQMAKFLGYRVIATASPDKFAYLRGLGAEHVLNYRDTDLIEQVRAITMERGVDAVLDTIGGEVTARAVEMLKFTGAISTLVEYDPIDPGLLFRKAPQINSISLGGAWLAKDMCAQLKMAFVGNKMMNCIASKDITIPKVIPVEFNADAVSEALNKQLDGHVFGKQIVQVS